MRPCYFCGKDFDTSRSDHICCPACETKPTPIKDVHELLDTNGVGLVGEPLLSRVSDVVAEWKQLNELRDSFQKQVWDTEIPTKTEWDELKAERAKLQDKLNRIAALELTRDPGRFGDMLQASDVFKILAER